VYGPQGDLDKIMFIRELKQIKQISKPQWLLMGDFNLIYRDQDKNNNRVNRGLMNQLRRALNYMEIKEVELVGRSYTCTNNQAHPTLTRIDRAFCTPLWEGMHANPIL
jgi:endonuclease/exonuclease/phosphatase family metal-dependent hydrolase